MNKVAKEYATALFQLAQEEGISETLFRDVQCLEEQLGQHPGYLELLTSPNLSQTEKRESIERVFGTLHPHAVALLCLMTGRGHGGELRETATAFLELYRQAKGICLALVESATPLTEEETDSLREALSKKYKKTVELSLTLNPALLGGMRIRIEGQLLDGTLRGRLDGIRHRLEEAVL